MKIFYQNLELNPVVQRIQSYINKWIQLVRRNGQTTALYCEMSTVWETKPRTTTSKDFLTVNGTGTGHKAYNPASYVIIMNFLASQDIPIFYEFQKFIKIFRTACHWSLY